MIFDERRDSILAIFDNIVKVKKQQQAQAEKRQTDEIEGTLAKQKTFVTQQSTIVPEIGMSPIDAIISRMNMDTVNRISQFEKFMMTDPSAANWDESLAMAKNHLALQDFSVAKVYPEKVRQ